MSERMMASPCSFGGKFMQFRLRILLFLMCAFCLAKRVEAPSKSLINNGNVFASDSLFSMSNYFNPHFVNHNSLE